MKNKTVGALLRSKKSWTKGYWARNEKGKRRDINAADACQFCLEGAIRRVYPDTWFVITNRVMDIIRAKFPDRTKYATLGIPEFNDDKRTTFTQVREVIREARI